MRFAGEIASAHGSIPAICGKSMSGAPTWSSVLEQPPSAGYTTTSSNRTISSAGIADFCERTWGERLLRLKRAPVSSSDDNNPLKDVSERLYCAHPGLPRLPGDREVPWNHNNHEQPSNVRMKTYKGFGKAVLSCDSVLASASPV